MEAQPTMNYVHLRCTGERVSVEEVEFLDISESIEGFDVMDFVCPVCGKSERSYVVRDR